MKNTYLQTSYYNFIKESKIDKVLYHGSPYIFENFFPKATFFSTNREFAENYSNQKSMDAAMDSQTNIYTVKVLGDIFDIENEKELDKLYEALPSEIEYTYNNFGFNAKVDKDEFIMNMKGYDIIEPIDGIKDMEIGDTFPDPSYARDTFVIVRKTDKHAIVLNQDNLNREINSKMNEDPRITELVDTFGRRIKGDRYSNTEHYLYFLDSLMRGGNKMGVPSKDEVEEFKKIESEIESSAIDDKLEKKYGKKFVLDSTKIKLDDTWRFYENEIVYESIKKMGYDGYVALENKEKTYCIFDPSKTVEIISYEFPIGHKFESFKDREKYLDFSKEIHKRVNNIDSKTPLSLWLNEFDIYKAFYNNIGVDEFIEDFKKKV
jgi:hypothetical protein